MGSVQTAYAASIDRAYAGQLYGLNPNRTVTYLAETTVITPGIVVTEGTTPAQAVKGGDAGVWGGIVVRRLDTEGNVTTNAIEYEVGEAMNVMQWGDIYVDLANTGSKGDPIFYTDTTGVISAGTASTGQTQITNGVLAEDVAAAGIALIRIKEGV